jgi:hypothetical protein
MRDPDLPLFRGELLLFPVVDRTGAGQKGDVAGKVLFIQQTLRLKAA